MGYAGGFDRGCSIEVLQRVAGGAQQLRDLMVGLMQLANNQGRCRRSVSVKPRSTAPSEPSTSTLITSGGERRPAAISSSKQTTATGNRSRITP